MQFPFLTLSPSYSFDHFSSTRYQSHPNRLEIINNILPFLTIPSILYIFPHLFIISNVWTGSIYLADGKVS